MSTDAEEFVLQHYGVMGMRWGKHTAATAAGTPVAKSRKELKALDKQSKAKDTAARDKAIDSARARYKENARKDYKAAKAQYKIDKMVIGKNEARKAFNQVKAKNIRDADLANQAKSGKETVAAIIGAGVLAVAYVGLTAAANRA